MAGEGTDRRRSVRVRTLGAVALAIAIVLAACGSDGDRPVAQSSADSAVVSAGAGDADATALMDEESVESTVGTTAVPPKRLEAHVLPGSAFDLFPYAGATLAVVGVEVDDVLNVRVGPGPEYQVVTTLASTSTDDAVATGRNRSVESGIWAELTIGDIVGWANTEYLKQLGAVNDDTKNLFETGDDHPRGENPERVARQAVRPYASMQPNSTVTIVDGPRGGDVTSVTVDVVNLGDDAIGGYRVVVFMDWFETEYRVRSVETTTLCTRGVDDGLCV